MASPAEHDSGRSRSDGTGWLRTLRSRLQHWKRSRSLQRELDALDAGELDRVLRDAGLARSDIPDLLRSRDGDNLLRRMMTRLGLNPDSRDGQTIVRDLRRVCVNCPGKRQCRAALGDVRPFDYHDFCTNAWVFDRLKR